MGVPPIRILVVDDEPEVESLIRMEFRRKIRKNEFEFYFATHGADALRQIESGLDLDLMLCDLNMPVMDGLTLLSRLAPQKLLMKQIVVSAYGDLKNIRSAMNLGAFDFVTKPIEFEDLETTIFKAYGVVTQLREAERTRDQLVETGKNLDLAEEQAKKLKEIDELKTRLFTNFSHEFRTPLTIIRGMASEIQENPDKYSEEGWPMIQRNVDHLLHLINQILDLRKIEANKLELNLKEGELIFMARYLFESFHSMAATKDIELSFHADENQFWGKFDESKLIQIMSNLLSNAIKYTPIGGEVNFAIYWEMAKNIAQIKLVVKDNGLGIPEEHLPHIFDQFYQAHGDGEIQGTGIGLALTQELTHLMNGEIFVQSTPNQGSTFSIHLPIEKIRNQAENIYSVELEPETSVYSDKFIPVIRDELPSLLIVEDSPDIQKYLIACLGESYSLSIAKDGEEGIEKALVDIPDIVLSDVMMPRKNGFELCETLKTDERTSHIPIILLTAKIDVDSKLAGLGLGADAYLAKPFDKKELLIRLEKLIAIRRNLQERYQSKDADVPAENPVTQKQDVFVGKFKNILIERLDDPEFHVPEMCEAIGMSRSSLHRKVKALTGLSTTHFMQEIRLEKGHRMLKTTNNNIADIAYMTGFSTPVYFSKSYKAKYGMSPRQSRNAPEK